MSEYWVSHKKYFCRYCDIYISDDAPSRQQHENGMRHKGNKDRFVRGLYKAGEKRKKDQEEEKREMARVEQAAQAAFSQDVGAGFAKPSTVAPTPSTSAAVRKLTLKPSNPFSDYSTPESLGYQDPDAERHAAEAEHRRTQGLAGNWEVVASASPSTPLFTPISAIGDASLKREAEVLVDEEDSRQFKLRKKTLAVGLGEIYDPGVIPIKLKKQEDSIAPVKLVEDAGTGSKPTDTPKWTKVEWRRPGEGVGLEVEGNRNFPHGDGGNEMKEGMKVPRFNHEAGETNRSLASEQPEHIDTAVKSEEPPPAPLVEVVGGSLFRKRKSLAGGNWGKRLV